MRSTLDIISASLWRCYLYFLAVYSLILTSFLSQPGWQRGGCLQTSFAQILNVNRGNHFFEFRFRDELISEACKEVTPINTGDVTSVLSMGLVQRSASDEPKGIVTRLHVRELVSTMPELCKEVVQARKDMEILDKAFDGSEVEAGKHTGLLCAQLIEAADPVEVIEQIETMYTLKCNKGTKIDKIMLEACITIKVLAVGSELNYRDGKVRSTAMNWTIVVSSVVCILAVQVASLADSGWVIQLPWRFLVGGYIGLVLSVIILAEVVKKRIRTSTVRFSPRRGRMYCALQNGDLNKEGTPGYVLPKALSSDQDVIKISCLQRATAQNQLMGTLTALFLTISFIIHYLGLRSVQWWVSVCELAVCMIMVCFRSIGSRASIKVSSSKCLFDTDLRSVGVIQPSARKQATLRSGDSMNPMAKSIRVHLGVREMGPQTQGDKAAAVLAGALRNWDLERLICATGLVHCRVVSSTIPGKRIVVHAGGTGLLSKSGYIRPSTLQVWAQEIDLEQIKSQSLIGWCVNGLMRNTDLELLGDFRNMTTEPIHIPAADMVVDWWLRSEGTNDWIAICDNLQWAAVLPLAILFVALDTTDDLEFKKALKNRQAVAEEECGSVAMAVAPSYESCNKWYG